MFPPETKILLAEDTEITRMVFHKMILKLGFHDVTLVGDGKAAAREIEGAHVLGKPFQLVISDWNMPEESGLFLLKRVRRDPRGARLPFIILTTNNEKEQVMEAIRAGVTAYLSKPFSLDALEKKIREAWGIIEKKKIA